MSSKAEANVKPWCPFCGIDIGRPSDAVERKMTEFPMGKCECGAVYVADATGHNIGSAMVECLVNACNDEWELTWELVPEDDYLTGRLENYDDVTHQIIPKRNLDGRAVRGVLFFVRLHSAMAEVVDRYKKNQDVQSGDVDVDDLRSKGIIPVLEPVRDPKRKKKRANKKLVRELTLSDNIDGLVDLCFDDQRTLRFIQRLLYEPEPAVRYKVVWTLGLVCARVSTRNPTPVADLLHRLFQACGDSASTSWGMVEAIGAIIACRPDVYGAFTRHLYNFLSDPVTLAPVLWGLGEIAVTRADLIRKTPFYSLFSLLNHEEAEVRALIACLLGRIKAKEAEFQLLPLQHDKSFVTIYEQGNPVETTVAEITTAAIKNIHKGDLDGK